MSTKKKERIFCRVEKNSGPRKGYLILAGELVVGWRRLKKEALVLADVYELSPAEYVAARLAEGLELAQNCPCDENCLLVDVTLLGSKS